MVSWYSVKLFKVQYITDFVIFHLRQLKSKNTVVHRRDELRRRPIRSDPDSQNTPELQPTRGMKRTMVGKIFSYDYFIVLECRFHFGSSHPDTGWRCKGPYGGAHQQLRNIDGGERPQRHQEVETRRRSLCEVEFSDFIKKLLQRNAERHVFRKHLSCKATLTSVI